MLHRFDYNGKRWRVETSGVSHEADGLHSVGIRFTCDETAQDVYGSLNPADVARPTDARLIAALESALRAEAPGVPLTLKPMMWAGDGSVVTYDHPIQYEVLGLPLGFEPIFVGQNLKVRPIRWQTLRRRDGVSGWGDDFETPEAALQALQAEFGASV